MLWAVSHSTIDLSTYSLSAPIMTVTTASPKEIDVLNVHVYYSEVRF